MRTTNWTNLGMLALSLAVAACTEKVTGNSTTGTSPTVPAGLTYQLEPSGTPGSPRGIILRWDADTDATLAYYNVYSRNSSTEAWGLRGSTTSISFHDDGIPALDYSVSAVGNGGYESALSNYIEIDERLALQAPDSLFSISLDSAVHLQWSDNAYLAEPTAFDHYRVYSTSYNLDNNTCASASWVLEGTTVSPTFLVGALPNGQPRCFAVSAISIEGYESLWSPLRQDTPRPDGHNVIVFTAAGSSTQSGFRFYKDLNNDGLVQPTELGLIGASTDTAMDFTITSDSTGLYLTPKRSATDVLVYGSAPIAALTSIDYAPVSGYSTSAIQAKPLWGYVFRFNEGTFYRYGGLRVSAVGSNYVIFDWSFQTDLGNPELLRRH